MRRYWPFIAALIAALGVTLAVTQNDDGTTVTIHLDGPGHKTVALPASESEVIDKLDGKVRDQDLRLDSLDQTSRAFDQGTIRRQTTGSDVVPPVPRGASFSQEGCVTRPVVNQSSRVGRPGLIVLHYTVSGNVTGWADVNSIVALFDNSRTQASSNYVIDNEGHCAYIVSESAKAWTQAGFNSASACSFEVINSGSESTYIGREPGPGIDKLARVVHDCAQRWGIPLRRGSVSGCSVTRTGVVQHADLGSCGGGHNDIHPFSDRGEVERVIAAASVGSVPPTSDHAKKLCGELKRIRRYIDRHGGDWHSDETRLARAKAIKRALAKPRHYSGFSGSWAYECKTGSGCRHVRSS